MTTRSKFRSRAKVERSEIPIFIIGANDSIAFLYFRIMKSFKIISGVAALMFIQISLTAQTASIMIEKNKSIAGDFYSDVINKGDTVTMKLIMAENFIDHNAAPNLPKGIEGFKQFLAMVSTAYPDVQVKVEEMIAEGDKVVVRLSV